MIQMEIFGKVEGKRKGAKSLKLNRQHPKNLVHIHITSTSICMNETLTMHCLATGKNKVYEKHGISDFYNYNFME